MTEKMKNWLTGFPLWNGEVLTVDYTDGIPEHCGLYCQGLEEVSRKADILGNGEIFNRLHFTLCRTADRSGDNIAHAQWLLALQGWIGQQSALGLAPVFGDVPQRERIWAHSGKLQDSKQAGTARYTAEITVEFISKF